MKGICSKEDKRGERVYCGSFGEAGGVLMEKWIKMGQSGDGIYK